MQISLPDKMYYKIGEVANAFNVNTSLIRFWEKEFDIIQPKKNKKGDRMFTPEDIANAVSFLVSDKANYITGETIHINGGMLMT